MASRWPSALTHCLCVACAALAPKPLDYKPLVLALGSAVVFGLGVGYFKGSDSVRWQTCRVASPPARWSDHPR